MMSPFFHIFFFLSQIHPDLSRSIQIYPKVEIVPREVADAAPTITGVFAPPKAHQLWIIDPSPVGHWRIAMTAWKKSPVAVGERSTSASLAGQIIHPDAGWRLRARMRMGNHGNMRSCQPMNRQVLHTLKLRIKGISTANLSCSESLPWFMMKTGTLCNTFSLFAWLGVKWVYIVYFHSLLKRPALDFCASWPVVPWEWEMDPEGNEPFEVDSGDTWTKVVRGWVDSGHRAGNAVEPAGFLLQIEELVTSQWMRLQSKSD